MLLLLLSLLALISGSVAGVLIPRDFTNSSTLLTYDYVVVGCGISGLVMSMRLTENPNISVLCLEAGPFDKYEDSILIPQFIGREIGGFYDWNVFTVPQNQLDGATRPIPLGKVVGGGSVINGMVWNRGNQEDYNAWQALGNAGWSWRDILPYFRKSETYTPVVYQGLDDQPVRPASNVHGNSGPVSVSYPKYFWQQSHYWFRAMFELGVPYVQDPDQGIGAGGYFMATNINVNNQTRSDARRNYYDPFIARKNYNILPNSHVTRILFNDTDADHPLKVTGVEYAGAPFAPRQTVLARKEVILAAGAIHSPQILQLSGIGPSNLLGSLNISILQDLPGVGSNLQDHCLVGTDYPFRTEAFISTDEGNFNASFMETAGNEYRVSKTGPWTAMASNALAFPSLEQITPHLPPSTVSTLTRLLEDSASYNMTVSNLPPSHLASTPLLLGYLTQVYPLLPRLSLPTTPLFEILNNNAGGLTVSLMHPLSRGTVTIGSTDPFDRPLIDPRWLTHPLDTAILLAALQFNAAILNTTAIRELQPSYRPDGVPQFPDEAFLTNWIKNGIRTEFHSSGTAAMMPRRLGGVVDDHLRVYGVSGLRVIDTSVFPVIPAAHLQSVAYAVAEKAADLVKADGDRW